MSADCCWPYYGSVARPGLRFRCRCRKRSKRPARSGREPRRCVRKQSVATRPSKKNCHTRFLVNDCLAAAKKRYTATIIEARKLDQPARDFQREAKRQEIEAKEAQRLADQPRREAGQQESAERFHAEEAAKTAAREQKLAAKAAKAEEGRRREAARQAKRQAKQEKRAQQDAEREPGRLPGKQADQPTELPTDPPELRARVLPQAIPWLARYSS